MGRGCEEQTNGASSHQFTPGQEVYGALERKDSKEIFHRITVGKAKCELTAEPQKRLTGQQKGFQGPRPTLAGVYSATPWRAFAQQLAARTPHFCCTPQGRVLWECCEGTDTESLRTPGLSGITKLIKSFGARRPGLESTRRARGPIRSLPQFPYSKMRTAVTLTL